MISPRQFAPQAVRDVEDAADWLAESPTGIELATRFISAVVDAADRISHRPLLGHKRLDILPDTFRFHRVRGFPYLLIYNAVRPSPVILRVVHMARNLGPLLADLDIPPDQES